MSQGKEEADADRPIALLNELARHIVDRRDMVGIDRMPQAEHIGQDRGAEQDGLFAKR